MIALGHLYRHRVTSPNPGLYSSKAKRYRHRRVHVDRRYAHACRERVTVAPRRVSLGRWNDRNPIIAVAGDTRPDAMGCTHNERRNKSTIQLLLMSGSVIPFAFRSFRAFALLISASTCAIIRIAFFSRTRSRLRKLQLCINLLYLTATT